jgi:hypothetical protein
MKALFVALALLAFGCSAGTSPADDFPALAYTTTASESGGFVVEVRTSPQPPARGSNDVELTVTHASDGTPAPDLDVQVQTWMPSMNHGSADPTVTDVGEGKYLVSGVYLYMPGTWELRTTLSGAVTDHATPTLSVP